MSQNSIVSYLSSQDHESSSQKLAERLSNALKKYYMDDNPELTKLNNTYDRYAAYEKAITRDKDFLKSIINGFNSFDLLPSNSYERYLSVIANRSDIEAIRSDWEFTGEDLTLAWANYLLESKKRDKQK